MRKTALFALIFALTTVLAGCSGSKTQDSNVKNDFAQAFAEAIAEKADGDHTQTEVQPSGEIPQDPPSHANHDKAVIDYTMVYKEVLDHYYVLLSEPSDEYEPGEGETGVLEAVMSMGCEPMEGIGYSTLDISGDGTPELLIGAVAGESGDGCYGNEIYAVYTCSSGTPTLSFEGWYRNRYRYTGNGSFFYQGSGGAMYSMFGSFILTVDGTGLSCNDYYFTFEKDESFTEIGFFHNTTGEWDTAVSEELSITDEQFWQKEAEYESLVQNIALTAFSAYDS